MPEFNDTVQRAYIVPRDASLLKPGASTAAFKDKIAAYVKERVSHYKQLRGGEPWFILSVAFSVSILVQSIPFRHLVAARVAGSDTAGPRPPLMLLAV